MIPSVIGLPLLSSIYSRNSISENLESNYYDDQEEILFQEKNEIKKLIK